MSDIEIRAVGYSWKVAVTDGDTITEHEVTIPPPVATRLGVDASDGEALEELLRSSFEFLLEREPASAILPEFSLEVIGRYFGEYETVIRDRLGRPRD